MLPDTRNDSPSSLHDKLEPRTREKLDRAILTRSPASYSACYKAHDLAARGISFSAFYRYARRLRTRHTFHNLAELTIDDAEAPEARLPRFLCQHLLDALLNESASPRAILQLTNAYHLAAKINLAREKLDIQKSPAPRKKSGYDPSAPWGRKDDGTPYTHAEFMVHLRRAVRDIYGCGLPGDDGPWDPDGEAASACSPDGEAANAFSPDGEAASGPDAEAPPSSPHGAPPAAAAPPNIPEKDRELYETLASSLHESDQPPAHSPLKVTPLPDDDDSLRDRSTDRSPHRADRTPEGRIRFERSDPPFSPNGAEPGPDPTALPDRLRLKAPFGFRNPDSTPDRR